MDKLKEAFVDDSCKIITTCPDCPNQSALWLISGNRLVKDYQVQYCDNCEKPYLVYVAVELTAKVKVYRCEAVE